MFRQFPACPVPPPVFPPNIQGAAWRFCLVFAGGAPGIRGGSRAMSGLVLPFQGPALCCAARPAEGRSQTHGCCVSVSKQPSDALICSPVEHLPVCSGLFYLRFSFCELSIIFAYFSNWSFFFFFKESFYM